MRRHQVSRKLSAILTSLLARTSYTRLSPRGQRILTAMAATAFFAGTWIAFERVDLDLARARLLPALLVAASAPLPLFLSAAEFFLTARIVDQRITASEALQVALLGSAANYLPLPGGTLVRLSALSDSSDPTRSLGHRTAATLCTGAIWVAIAASLATIALLAFPRPIPAIAMGVVGAAAGTVGYLLLRAARPSPSLRIAGARVVALETLSAILAAARFHLALLALGWDPGIAPAIVIAAASPLSALLGLAPGGLGLREVLSAALAAVAGIDPGLGFLASAALRLSGGLASAAIAALFAGVRPGTGLTEPT